ncbi:MAG: hypothetical protein NTW05_29035, partial [Pseudonocardiales bacterium]|nr:hypothetical protein [Pseudonocardiales bacterium]
MPVDLPAVLDALCARTGARSARVVDGRVGAVVAVSGDPGTADPVDGPSAVARLLHEAGPDPRTADRGDVCVTTPHSVHLLRPVVGAPEAFVHLRLAGDGEVDRARSTLAEPLLHELVRSALHGTDPRPSSVAPGAGGERGRATVPGPRTAGDDLAARPPTVTVPAQAPPPGRGPAGGGGPAPAPRRGAPPVPLRPDRRPGTRMPV